MNEPAPPTLAHSRFEYGYIPGINQGGQLLSGESDSEACLVGWELGRHEVERKLAFVRPYSPRSFSFLTTSLATSVLNIIHLLILLSLSHGTA